ncbi:MAG TPA: hypothetical protein VN704_07455 [Verrucomicrobiae bacterium]|nr:hypothetical protein [Verrucomicrobiae bacterium]
MSDKEFIKNIKTNHDKENLLKESVKAIDKIIENSEKKIFLEDSIKNIVNGSDNIIINIQLLNKEKRKELLDMYIRILDTLKQRVSEIQE